MKNRNTGEFVDNIHWWFWNGLDFPGLLTRSTFSELMGECLSSVERSLLVRSSIASEMGVQSQSQIKDVQALQEKINRHLGRSDPNSKIENYFEEQAGDALKAYINILEYWGLGYSWFEAVDHLNRPGVIIYYGSQPKLFVLRDEIQFLQGRPFRFKLSIRGSSLSFDEDDGELALSYRDVTGKTGGFLSSPVRTL